MKANDEKRGLERVWSRLLTGHAEPRRWLATTWCSAA